MTFSLSRRRLTLGAGAVLLGSSIALPVYFKARPSRSEPQPAIDSFSAALVDTVVPADDYPGALDIGLHGKLLEYATQQPKWQARLVLVEAAIDKLALSTHKQAFSKLAIDQRETLLLDLLQRVSPLRHEVARFRHLVLAWYYASPEGRASVAYQLPANYPAYPG